MATNTNALKLFAQQTRSKLVSAVKTKMQRVLTEDSAEMRGKRNEIEQLRKEIALKSQGNGNGEERVIEEVAYTWFNRVMALRFMDANGYNLPMVITPAEGQIRPEILQEAMGGNTDEAWHITADDLLLPENSLYKKLLLAVCNNYNQSMPFLFESISDYTELLLPDELLSDQSFVTDIRKGMGDEDCQNVEIMGWLYQFYITDRKQDAEAKKSKKGGLKSDEQAAATQLFTPHWIVRYMVENTLGRIWTALHPDTALKAEMPYYIEPADGEADPIPEDIRSVTDIRFIDPCMGSGHVLVYAFDLLCKMYEEEGYRTKEIPALILENNLYGMDIDKRCYQLASFALTMKATAYYNRYLRRDPVKPHVIYLQNIDHDTIAASGNWDEKSLVWQFEHIDTIGSLLKITPEECEKMKVANGLWGEQQRVMKSEAEYLSRGYHCVVTNPPYLGKGFCDELKAYVQKEYPNSKADTMATFMERCMEYCTPKGKMAMINMQSWMFLSSFEKLRKDIIEHYQIDSLLHLGAHAFTEISGEIVQSVSFVITIPQSYDKIKAIGKGSYYRLTEEKNSFDKEQMFLQAKGKHYKNKEYLGVPQTNFMKFPGYPLGYWCSSKIIETFTRNLSLSAVCKPTQGLATADNDRFLRSWFEVAHSRIGFGYANAALAARAQEKWFPHNKGGNQRKWYGNQDTVVNWENDGYEIKHFTDNKGKLRSRPQNINFYFKPAVSWSVIISGLYTFRYYPKGFIPNMCGMCCYTDEPELNLYILGLSNTKVASLIFDLINPTFNLSNGVFGMLPFIDKQSQEITDTTKQNISISKSDWDAHETSWDFAQNELLALTGESSQDIWGNYASYFNRTASTPQPHMESLAYRVNTYKAKWETQFHRLHANEEELNRMFIDIYGLQDELTPDVPLDEVTILQQGEISIEEGKLVWHNDVIVKQFLSYLAGCFMGRFSPDKPGLIIANQHQDLTALGLQVDGIESSPRSTLSIDDDGIVPIIQEPDFFADDMTGRIQLAIKQLFGEAAYYENMKYIEQTIGKSLRDYLYKDYYADHQQTYSVKGAKRPIYWLFSSRMGDKHKKGYFKALVYMHRIEPDTLSKLHADYVHPYINKVEQQLREAEEESLRDDQTQAQRNRAMKQVNELKDKAKEVKEFEQQLVEMASHRPAIDLDDGVKANYPKFYPLVEPVKGLE